jgi:hypothetical protein
VDGDISAARFASSIFPASGFSCPQTKSTPAHTKVMQTVETVEKISFSKIIFEKGERHAKKHLVFLCSAQHFGKSWAVSQPVVGDFF